MTPEERVLEIQRRSVNMALTGREVWDSIREALSAARADALEEAALLVERRQVAGWVPHGAGPAFAQLAQSIRALLEDTGQ